MNLFIDYFKRDLGEINCGTSPITISLLFAAPFAAAAISEQSNYSAYRYIDR
jgi:hypothetical protein